jgi:2-oxoglutarate ferredoxin oxidoreductase subunit delta
MANWTAPPSAGLTGSFFSERLFMGTTPSADQPAPGTEAPVAAARPRKGPRGKIVIFGTWCKGCGICVAFCPTKVLSLDADGHPVVSAPEKCTACHFCDTHCPDLAIVVTRMQD